LLHHVCQRIRWWGRCIVSYATCNRLFRSHLVLKRLTEPKKFLALDEKMCGFSSPVLVDVGVPGTPESAYFVSLMFCVLDNNIRNVLSGAGFSAQEMAKFVGWRLPGIRPDNPARGRILAPPPPCKAFEKRLRT
jgi:hypothetical protein